MFQDALREFKVWVGLYLGGVSEDREDLWPASSLLRQERKAGFLTWSFFHHSSAHSMPRHDPRWRPGLFMPWPVMWHVQDLLRTFSANVSSSTQWDVWFTVWESHLSDKVVPGLRFYPGDVASGFVLKKAKSKSIWNCFERALFFKNVFQYISHA